MEDDVRPQIVDGYQMEALDGEILLYHPASTNILHSNQSGYLIWRLCDGQRTVAEICQLLVDAYPEAAGEIENDVRETLEIFKEYGAVTWE